MWPKPDAESEMESLLCKLMSDPRGQLDVQHNGALLRIFEAFLGLRDDKQRLQERLRDAARERELIISRCNMAEKDWECEKQDFRDEIKRLEVRLARVSKRGIAEVTLARQDSKIHARKFSGKDNRETIFGFSRTVRRANYEERVWNNQRATMRPLPAVAEPDMRSSRKLGPKKSVTSIRADLPLSTPPAKDLRFSLVDALQSDPGTAAEQAESTSSGSMGLSIPDNNLLLSGPYGEAKYDADRSSTFSQDLVEFGSTFAIRRNIEPAVVMPELFKLFAPKTADANRSFSAPSAPAPYLESKAATAEFSVLKRPTVMARASDFFNKWRPQLHMESSQSRRFSFEPGDDSPLLRTSDHDGVLRKSLSLNSLTASHTPRKTMAEPILSSVVHSATTEFPSSLSRIPTPVYVTRSLARPRQEREDSASSLLTAIRRSDESPVRRSSSVYSTSSLKGFDNISGLRTDRSSALPSSTFRSPAPSLKSTNTLPGMEKDSNNPLREQTNALRSAGLATAAARAAIAAVPSPTDPARGTAGSVGCDRRMSSKLVVAQHKLGLKHPPDMSDTKQENMHLSEASQ